jgi:hypothetical protein
MQKLEHILGRKKINHGDTGNPVSLYRASVRSRLINIQSASLVEVFRISRLLESFAVKKKKGVSVF